MQPTPQINHHALQSLKNQHLLSLTFTISHAWSTWLHEQSSSQTGQCSRWPLALCMWSRLQGQQGWCTTQNVLLVCTFQEGWVALSFPIYHSRNRMVHLSKNGDSQAVPAGIQFLPFLLHKHHTNHRQLPISGTITFQTNGQHFCTMAEAALAWNLLHPEDVNPQLLSYILWKWVIFPISWEMSYFPVYGCSSKQQPQHLDCLSKQFSSYVFVLCLKEGRDTQFCSRTTAETSSCNPSLVKPWLHCFSKPWWWWHLDAAGRYHNRFFFFLPDDKWCSCFTGKVFVLLQLSLVITGVVTSTVFNKIYQSTLNWYSGFCFILSFLAGCLSLLPLR